MNQRSNPNSYQHSKAAQSHSVITQQVLVNSWAERSVVDEPIERGWCSQRNIVVAGGDAEYFVDAAGRQHFNFAQQIWLDASVQMAYGRVYTTALETLAVNLLSMATPERNHRTAIGVASRRAVSLARAFCEECLFGGPEDAWVLPRQTVKAWLASHRGGAMARRRA